MSLDHPAIYKAYAGTVISISDENGAVDKDGKSVSLDSSLVAKARTEIDEEYAKVKYKEFRTLITWMHLKTTRNGASFN